MLTSIKGYKPTVKDLRNRYECMTSIAHLVYLKMHTANIYQSKIFAECLLERGVN